MNVKNFDGLIVFGSKVPIYFLLIYLVCLFAFVFFSPIGWCLYQGQPVSPLRQGKKYLFRSI